MISIPPPPRNIKKVFAAIIEHRRSCRVFVPLPAPRANWGGEDCALDEVKGGGNKSQQNTSQMVIWYFTRLIIMVTAHGFHLVGVFQTLADVQYLSVDPSKTVKIPIVFLYSCQQLISLSFS